MTSKFLQVMRPFMSITPEVAKPEREVRFNEKLAWTVGALIIYFVMTITPLYGIEFNTANDPFQWLRTVMASQKGTLAELGIGPIVTAGLIMQILTGSKIINVNMSDPEERALYTGAQKVMSMVMTLFEGVAYIVGGAYNNSAGQSPSSDAMVWILVQLMAAGIAIILLDEMVQKGWGLGSGISLFIAGGVALTLVWSMLSLVPGGDNMPQGMLWATFTVISKGDFSIEGLSAIVIRPLQSDFSLLALVATLIVFLVVVYFESMRIELPITHADYKGIKASYPIKLLYVSNIPVILASAVFADLYFVSSALSHAFPDNLLVSFLGKFDPTNNNPIGGLCYYLRPPSGLFGAAGLLASGNNISRALIYAFILVFLSVGFSMMWIETAGMSPRDVAKQLVDAGMQIPGWRRNEKVIEKRLNMYIPSAAFLGGLFIGVLAAGADFLGAIGSGVGILLSVSIMRQYFDILVKERAAEMHPAFRQFLGLF